MDIYSVSGNSVSGGDIGMNPDANFFIGLMELVFDFMKTPITIYGFTFSYWDVFLIIIVFSAICVFIRGVFND